MRDDQFDKLYAKLNEMHEYNKSLFGWMLSVSATLGLLIAIGLGILDALRHTYR